MREKFKIKLLLSFCLNGNFLRSDTYPIDAKGKENPLLHTAENSDNQSRFAALNGILILAEQSILNRMKDLDGR